MPSSDLLEDTLTSTTAKRRHPWHLASAWLPVLVCILVISLESTVAFGADHTSGPLQRFYEFFFGPVVGNSSCYSQMWALYGLRDFIRGMVSCVLVDDAARRAGAASNLVSACDGYGRNVSGGFG